MNAVCTAKKDDEKKRLLNAIFLNFFMHYCNNLMSSCNINVKFTEFKETIAKLLRNTSL